MKLEKLFQEEIKKKLQPRKPLFFTRVKLLVCRDSGEWAENCNGLLIVYSLNNSHYFAIMNVTRFQIHFDMEIYTNFLNYARDIGETKSLLFLVPLRQKIVKFLFVLESKQELLQLKRVLQSFLYRSEEEIKLSFFQQPQVKEIIEKAQISSHLLEHNLRFRDEVKEEINVYFEEIEKLQKKKNNTGFKAYGLGREEWKLANEEIDFLKEKRKSELIDVLVRYQKGARVA